MDQNISTKVKEDTEASANRWHMWCRLCAKEDQQSNVNVCTRREEDQRNSNANPSILATVGLYFSVNIEDDEILPKTLCVECHRLISSLVTFQERVAKVQKMFSTLQFAKEGEHFDLHTIRLKYGLADKQPLSEIYYCETKQNINEIDSKAVAVKRSDPLEHTNGSIGLEMVHGCSDDVESTALENNDIEKQKFVHTTIRSAPQRNCRSGKNRECNANSRMTQNAKENEKTKVDLQNDTTKPQLGITVDPVDILPCAQCTRQFVTQKQLDRHLKQHEPSTMLPCPYCEKHFTTNWGVQIHIKAIHMDERPFICEECGIGVHTKGALKEHMLTHSDETPFVCATCYKGFKDRNRLKKHMEVHDPTKHVCAECGLQLNTRATLNRHLLVHSDAMQHKCDYCGRAFKRAKTLKSHLILHTGLKPYQCDFCDRSFATCSNFRTHKKKIHPTELAAQEAAGCAKPYTHNIPKLEALKAVAKVADNLTPVVFKRSGHYALGSSRKSKFKSTDIDGSNEIPQEACMTNSEN